MKQSMLWQTVRGRLLLLAIGVELLMLTLLVLNSARLLHGAMTSRRHGMPSRLHRFLMQH